MDKKDTRLRTLIVDDEPLAVERLQLICARLPLIELAGTASDGASALNLVQKLAPDLVLLDITMPRLSGMDVARALGKLAHRPAVIFVTAHTQFAVEAFDIAAIDYVLKPVAQDRLAKAVERVLSSRASAGETGEEVSGVRGDNHAKEFWVPHKSELKRIETCCIDRIEAERDYMRLHVGPCSYLMHQTIKALAARLDSAHFIRLHRSHIVRIDTIAGLKHEGGGIWHARLTDGSEIRIGRTYLAEAKAIAGR